MPTESTPTAKPNRKIGLGMWGLGGGDPSGPAYGEISEHDAYETLKSIVDSYQISFFDTAPAYGGGQAERILGRLKRETPSRDLSIQTKIGVRTWAEGLKLDESSMRECFTYSLGNLRGSTPASVLLHLIDDKTSSEIEAAVCVMKLLASEFDVPRVGISLKSPLDIIRLRDIIQEVDLIETNFSVFDTRILLPEIQAILHHGSTRVIARTPLNYGFITDSPPRREELSGADHRRFIPEGRWDSWVSAREALRAYVNRKFDTKVSLGQIGLLFCAHFDFVEHLIPGATTVQQAKELFDIAHELELGDDEVSDLIEIGSKLGG